MSGTVLVIGAGGLGCPVLVGLAAAGVERVLLLDHDRVDETNLSRQMLYCENDVGRPKAEAARDAIALRFPSIRVEPLVRRFDADARPLLDEAALVVDGSDNFPTRFLANDLACAHGKPLVHGAALRWLGQVLTVLPGETACLRCVFEGEPPPGAAPTCAEAGVASPLVGLVGGWMAEEAVRVLRGERPSTAGRLRVLDAWAGKERFAEVGIDPACSHGVR